MDDLGPRFWLKALGLLIAFGLGGFLLFWLLGRAWYAWGAFGALIVAFALIAAAGWTYDRRQAKHYEELERDLST